MSASPKRSASVGVECPSWRRVVSVNGPISCSPTASSRTSRAARPKSASENGGPHSRRSTSSLDPAPIAAAGPQIRGGTPPAPRSPGM